MAAPDMSLQSSVTARPAKGYEGMLDVAFPNNAVVTAVNADTVSIPFGKGVAFKASAPPTELSVTLPTAQADNIMGISVFRHGYSRAWTDAAGVVHGELDATGLVPGCSFGVARAGRMLVTAGSNVTAGVSRLYIRRAGGTLGALEGASDSTNMVDCTNAGVWMSTVTAGNLAWLEFNFTGLKT